jgi:predicted nucleic acid-binding protein
MTPSPSPAVLAWIAKRQKSDQLFITTITVAELLYGVELLPSGRRRSNLAAEAESMFKEDFSERVLPFEMESARAFSRIASQRRRAGKSITELDAQIACIVSVHEAVLATRNTSDFEGCGIRVLNPWLD